MPFPDGWNTDLNLGPLGPRKPTDIKSIAAFAKGATTADFADNAILWIDITGANPHTPTPALSASKPITSPPFGTLEYGAIHLGTGQGAFDVNNPNNPYPLLPPQPKAQIFCATVYVKNDGVNIIEVSFDGFNVHWELLAGESFIWRDRYVAGIALRFPAGSAAGAFRVQAW